jgi:3-keto-L-gulonate-6-phosphate decarboxylase
VNLTEKIEYILEVGAEVLNESGIRNIRELAKTHRTAEIYFHQDL